jgi:hypothetical protein
MSASAIPVHLLKRLLPRPLKRVMKRAYQQRQLDDALRRVAQLRGDQIPSRALLEDLQSGWANQGMAARTDYLAEVCRQGVRAERAILECGSGLTTLLLGMLAGRRGVPVWSLEHLPEWRARVVSTLTRHDIPGVQLVLAPLKDFGTFTWYTPPEALPPNFDLVVCDGPPSETNGGRYGMLPVMRGRVDERTIILLDDAERPSEHEVLTQWKHDGAVTVAVRETPSGAFALVRGVL